jgi:outer membrane protein assembly factor BamB
MAVSAAEDSMKNYAVWALLSLSSVALAHDPTPVADWPNFGGPNRTNAADGPKLLDKWPREGPLKVWEVNDLGSGYSAPVVTGEHIFLMSGEESSEFLICLAAVTGKLVWKEKVGPLFKNEYGDGPRGSPTVSGGRVFAIGANGDLLAADAATGNRLWSVKLVHDLGGEVPGWGYSESPLVDGDLVICTPGGKRGTLAAFEVNSGKVVWRSDKWTDQAMYSSLAVVEIGESRQYVGVTREHVTGVSANNGDVLWQQPFDSSVVVAQSPIIEGDVVYVTASGGTGSRGFRLRGDGTAEVIYSNKVMKNLPGGVSSHGGHVYGYSDGTGWVCQNLKTGERVWSSRDFPKGTLTIADGKLVMLSEETGEVALAVAQNDNLKIVARFELTPRSKNRREQGRVWTVPVVRGGRLYLRDQDYLFCFDLR